MSNPLRRGGWMITLPTTAIVVAYFAFVFMPGKAQIAELRRQLMTQQQLVMSTGGRSPRLLELERNLAETRSYVDQRKSQLPRAEELAGVFADISRAAQQTGVRTTHISPGDPENVPPLVRMPLELHCDGAFDQLAAFLIEIEQLPRTIWIDGLAIEANSEGGRPLVCTLNLVVFGDQSEISD